MENKRIRPLMRVVKYQRAREWTKLVVPIALSLRIRCLDRRLLSKKSLERARSPLGRERHSRQVLRTNPKAL